MKKALIGILILIPIIILGIVTLVSSIASVAAHIGVESIQIKLNEEYEEDDYITLSFNDVANTTISLLDYLEVEVLPIHASNPIVEWKIVDLQILDQEYESSYKYYIDNKEDENVAVIDPAAMLVDDKGNEVETSTTGKLEINTYCTFTIKAMAENYQDQTMIKVVGFDVERMVLSTKKESITVGDSIMISASYTPIDSIVSKVEWTSSNEEVAKVDPNGVLTAYKEGNAIIKCKAYKYTNDSLFVENSINVVVNKALTLYGNNIYSSSNTLSLSALGISQYDSLEGCSVLDDTLTLSSPIAYINIDGNVVTIKKCEEDDITINQTSVLDTITGHVVAISNMKIQLQASYKSTFNSNGVNPVWTSSNEEIASIDANGLLTTKSSGLVTITATFGSKSAYIELNLQNKVTSMQLQTTDSLLSVGLARETVFASHKYVDAKNSDSKELNSVNIIIKGEPKNSSIDEVRAFYDAYVFEIVEGSKYAEFDILDTNKLVFNNSLEGQGKQSIKIKVSAKYPRYEAFESYTAATVTVNAIYGIDVSNYDELKKAVNEQYSYAYTPGNLIETTNNQYVCTNLTEVAKVSSNKTLGICITENIVIPEEIASENIAMNVYGDIYGNNHMISAARGQLEGDHEIFNISWSNVCMSNLTIRGNDLGEDTEITSGDASELWGHTLIIESKENRDKYRLLNVNVEYCILENARCSAQINAADVSMTGCIVRNMSNVGMYIFNTINTSNNVEYILPINLTVKNMIFSNCLGTAFDLDTSAFGISDRDKTKYRYASTKEENNKYIRDNIVANHLNGSFTQKGFLDIYNWTSTEDVSLVKTGEQELDDILKVASSTLIGTDPSLVEFRYRYKSVDYFHLGFMVESMDVSELDNPLALNETVWMDINLEDKRFNEFSVSEIKDETMKAILERFGISIYAYKNTADLKPSSTYVINEKLIDKLHG